MRKLVLATALLAGLDGPALAQGWQEFDYPDPGFSVTFPGTPTVESGTYRAGDATLPEKMYSLKQDSRLYQVEVVDFSSSPISKADAIKQVVAAWAAKGRVVEDTFARIDNEFGRNLNVAENDGSRSVGSIYFVGRKLYIIKGTSLPGDKDPQSNDPTRFKESLSFIAPPGEAPAARGGRRGASDGDQP